jgi:hypothetical protein
MPSLKIYISDRDKEILDSIAKECQMATGDVLRRMLQIGLTEFREHLDESKSLPGFFTSLVLGIKAKPVRIDRGDTYIADDQRIRLERQVGIYRETVMDAYTVELPQKEEV